jgi:hypothetical protein
MAKGKALTFPKNATDAEVLELAKANWMERHTEVDADGNRSFKGNNKYTPFQGKRGGKLLLFVWGGGTLKLYKLAAEVQCGPRQVWED